MITIITGNNDLQIYDLNLVQCPSGCTVYMDTGRRYITEVIDDDDVTGSAPGRGAV